MKFEWVRLVGDGDYGRDTCAAQLPNGVIVRVREWTPEAELPTTVALQFVPGVRIAWEDGERVLVALEST